MSAAEVLAHYYNDLLRRCDPSGRPTNLPRHDQMIYYVISVRCEMDMNGFDSVFDQLLTEQELLFFIEALNDLDASSVAKLFATGHQRLKSKGFFEGEMLRVSQLTDENTESCLLEDLEEEIRSIDELWQLDDRLINLIPNSDA